MSRIINYLFLLFLFILIYSTLGCITDRKIKDLLYLGRIYSSQVLDIFANFKSSLH